MKNISEFYSGLLIGILTVFMALGLMAEHMSYSREAKAQSSAYSYPYHGSSIVQGSLAKVGGKDVLGMILNAIQGEYYITVDGININSSTNMETLNLSGVLNKSYTLKVVRAIDGSIEGVIAN